MAHSSGASVPTELGTKKISTLLRMYAVPGIIAMTASSLYNMVDSIFIGHIRNVGAYAISGLAVTFPLMNLSAAMGTLVGVGAMTMISVMLGQKNYDTACKVLGNVLSLNTIIGVLFTIFTLAFLDPILRFFGASDQTLPFARDYMVIILLGNVITHLYHGFNGIIRSSGNPKTAMTLTLFTVLSNAALDPLFIFTFDMGIKGAAVATILCQALALAYSVWFLSDKDRIPHFGKHPFQLNWRIAKSSLAIGLGPFLMNAAGCVVAIFINRQFSRYGGDMAIGAYGIANRITFMFVMIVMGINQGLQPIAGYNYGARLYSRVRQVFLLSAMWAMVVTTLCFAVCEFLPNAAASLFTNDPQLKALAARGLKIMNIFMPIVGFSIVAGNFFQCLGMVKTSIFLSLSRQLLFLVPVVYFLPTLLAEKGVWMSFPISDLMAVLFSAFLILRLFRKFSKLKDGDDPSILGSSI